MHASLLVVTLLVAGALLAAAGTLRLHARSAVAMCACASLRIGRTARPPRRSSGSSTDSTNGCCSAGGVGCWSANRRWRSKLIWCPGPAAESRGAGRQLSRAQAECRRSGVAERLPQHPARAISRPARQAALRAAPEEALGVHHAPARPRPTRIRAAFDGPLARRDAGDGRSVLGSARAHADSGVVRAQRKAAVQATRAARIAGAHGGRAPGARPRRPRSTRPNCAARSMFSIVPCSLGSCASWPRPGPRARRSPPCCAPAAPRTSS